MEWQRETYRSPRTGSSPIQRRSFPLSHKVIDNPTSPPPPRGETHVDVRPHVPVLRGLTFEVKPGQYVALVGASGCGKSTTVGLIERFYDPLVGDIVVDGLNVAGYNLAEYRKNISLVSQEPT